MRLKTHLFCFVLGSLLIIDDTNGSQSPVTTPQISPPCEVTAPNGTSASSAEPAPSSHGSRLLSLGPFGLWPNGTVVFKPGGAGFVTRDGSLGMKFGWTRGVRGRLQIEGHRLDGPASPLRAHIPDGYGDFGFQATSLIFATPGCWEVTGRVGEASVTFVTMVLKIGDGPRWVWNPPGLER